MGSKKFKKRQRTIVMTEREVEKIKREATVQAINVCAAIPLVILHDDFNFGKVRLNRFIERFGVHWSCIGDTCELIDLVHLAEELSCAKFEIEVKD